MSNKKIGNGFEAEFCEKLFQNGYWVHNLSQNAAGQPADVVAVKTVFRTSLTARSVPARYSVYLALRTISEWL